MYFLKSKCNYITCTNSFFFFFSYRKGVAKQMKCMVQKIKYCDKYLLNAMTHQPEAAACLSENDFQKNCSKYI